MRLMTLVSYGLAMLAEEPMLDESPRWINFVQYWIGIPVKAGREDSHLIVSVCGSQTLKKVRSNEYALGELAIRTLR